MSSALTLYSVMTAALAAPAAGLFGSLPGGFRRRHFFDRAAPPRRRHVEYDAVRVAVLHFEERIRVSVLPSRQIGAAAGGDGFFRLIEIVNPHSEMKQAGLFALFGADLEQRHVDGAVAHVKAASGLAGPLEAEGFFIEFR